MSRSSATAEDLIKRASSTLSSSASHDDMQPKVPSSQTSNFGPTLEDALEPIAVIGFSLNLPGGVDDCSAFWQMLLDARCTASRVPERCFNVDAFYHEQGHRPDAINVTEGHFLDGDITRFDAPFFSISASEAASMDPQHRNMLEASYHAFENAGIPMENLQNSKIGVYTGSFDNDYKGVATPDLDLIPQHAATGTALTMLAARLSWFFNLKGPCMNVDTACSSSLVALDIACQALRAGECEQALVCGANTLSGMTSWLSLTNMGFLSPDGRCFSFDSRANGYARGEGFVALVLKPLSSAIRDKDLLRGIIRSSGTNQDGRTPRITQPSGNSQCELIRHVYQKAGLDFQATRFFEAHGTGTSLGDPTECAAISSVFADYLSEDQPLYVGAVKSNIGHLEGASGLAGLVKALLALERAIIPPNTNFETLNPLVEPYASRLQFPTKPVPWPNTGLRRASVNSFGYGGTNAHVVLDDVANFLQLRGLCGNHQTVIRPNIYPSPKADPTGLFKSHTEIESRTPSLIMISAFDRHAVQRQAEALERYFGTLNLGSTSLYIKDLAYTLNEKRTHFPWRSVSVCYGKDDLTTLSSRLSLPYLAMENRKLVLVFTGQGAQYTRMAVDLLEYSVFIETLRNAEAAIKEIGCTFSILEELARSQQSRVNEPEVSQSLCTALQITLFEFYHSIGLRPQYVLGHSSGEIAAAYAKGAISLQEAMELAYLRGRAVTEMRRTNNEAGAMMAVGLTDTTAISYLSEFRDLNIACYNGPSSLTISGSRLELLRLKETLDSQNVFARLLNVDVAYHSPSLQSAAEWYKSQIRLNPRVYNTGNSAPKMMSSVTERFVQDKDLRDAEYWTRNLLYAVRFCQALQKVGSKVQSLDDSCSLSVLEVGPHSTLRNPVLGSLKSLQGEINFTYQSSLDRKLSSVNTLLSSVGTLFCQGFDVSLQCANSAFQDGRHPSPRCLTDLPGYVFDHSRAYLAESRTNKLHRTRKHSRKGLLGSPISDWNRNEPRWRHFLRVSELPWIVDHQVDSQILFPAAGFLTMAIENMYDLFSHRNDIRGFALPEMKVSHALIIPNDQAGIEVQVSFYSDLHTKTATPTSYAFLCCSFSDDNWHEHCRGRIEIEFDASLAPEESGTLSFERHYPSFLGQYAEFEHSCTLSTEKELLYEFLKKSVKFDYGDSFQRLHNIRYSMTGEAFAHVKDLRADNETVGSVENFFRPHPASIDAAAQLALVGLSRGGTQNIPTTVPSTLRNIWINARSSPLYGKSPNLLMFARTSRIGFRKSVGSISALFEETKEPAFIIGSLESIDISTSSSVQLRTLPKQLCLNLTWKPDIDLMTHHQVYEYCESQWISEEVEIQFCKNVDLLIYYYLVSAWDQLDYGKVKVMPAHSQRYLEWMNWHLENFRKMADRYDTSLLTKLVQSEEHIIQLKNQVASANTRGKRFVEVGDKLFIILNQETDPPEIILDDGLTNGSNPEMLRQIPCVSHLQNYLDLLAHKHPNMNILEIGDGNGMLTEVLLDTLTGEGQSRYQSYIYTEKDSSFPERIYKRRRNEQERINFKAFDVKRNAMDQEFEMRSFDIVIARNFSRNTDKIRTAVENVQKLLKPGGQLILLENVRPELVRGGFLPGLNQDWWLSEEQERHYSPYLTSKKWQQTLSDLGFSDDLLTFRDYQDERCHELSVIIASLPKDKLEPTCTLPLLVLLDPTSSEQVAVASILSTEANSEMCTILSLTDIQHHTNLSAFRIVSLLELDSSFLSRMTKDQFTAVKRLLTTSLDILWVSRSDISQSEYPQLSIINGLARTTRNEREELSLLTLSLQSTSRDPTRLTTVIQKCMSYALETLQTRELEFREINGNINILRLQQNLQLDEELYLRSTNQLQRTLKHLKDCPSIQLAIELPGQLNSLHFVHDRLAESPLAPDEVEIRVHSADLSLADVLTALGQTNHTTFGTTCAGEVAKIGRDIQDLQPGDRVATLVNGTIRTYVRQRGTHIIRIPHSVSYSSATALFLPNLISSIALVKHAQIEHGETILLHSAAGAVGLAAIQVAQRLGAKVLATVESDDEREFISNSYGIPKEQIFPRHSALLAHTIWQQTLGQGVDVVIKSVFDDEAGVSWELIAPSGRFVEIGNGATQHRSKTMMRPCANNVSFYHLDVSDPEIQSKQWFRLLLRAVVRDMCNQSDKTALPITIVKIDQVHQAFVKINSGQHIGNFVLDMVSDCSIPVSLELSSGNRFSSEATYVISGGLGGLGRNIARWMVSRGAKHLLLLSRRGPLTEKQHDFIQEMRSLARIETPLCDVTHLENLKAVMAQYTQSMPPVKGLLQCQMVIKDAILEKMDFETWQTAVEPKVVGSWNLHTVLPTGLDFFILLSSVAGVLGSPSQANYAAGNTYQDALAAYRLHHKMKAVSIALGWLEGEGFVAENTRALRNMRNTRYLIPMTQADLLAILDKFCDPRLSLEDLAAAQVAYGIGLPTALRAQKLEEPDFMSAPPWRVLQNQAQRQALNQEGQLEAVDDTSHRLSNAFTRENAVSVITELFVQKLCRMLGLESDQINIGKPLYNFGVDSLLAVELRNWCTKVLSCDVSVFEFLESTPLKELVTLLTSRSKYCEGLFN